MFAKLTAAMVLSSEMTQGFSSKLFETLLLIMNKTSSLLGLNRYFIEASIVVEFVYCLPIPYENITGQVLKLSDWFRLHLRVSDAVKAFVRIRIVLKG